MIVKKVIIGRVPLDELLYSGRTERSKNQEQEWEMRIIKQRILPKGR